MKKKSSYGDLQEKIRYLELPPIEVWGNKYSDKNYLINFDTGDFTCICPKTSLPDFAHIYIEYIPSKWCVELKSFKEYLLSYRSLGIFHEHAVNKILEDMVKASKPRYMKVRGEFNPRGGITTVVEAMYGSYSLVRK